MDFPDDEPIVFFACPGGVFFAGAWVTAAREAWGVGTADGGGFVGAGLAVAIGFVAGGVGVDATVFEVADGGAAGGATYAPPACGTGT